MSDLPDPWRAYARLQEQLARTRRLDRYSCGLERALNHVLAGAPSAVEDLDRVIRSEGRNERRRTVLRRIYLSGESCVETPAHEVAIDARRLVRRVRAQVTADQWLLLRALGEGHDYKEVATVTNTTPGALRARVLRLRRGIVVALGAEHAGVRVRLTVAS